MDQISDLRPRTAPRLTERVAFPLREFLHAEATSGILLFVSALVALLWANSAWSSSYSDLWATSVTFGGGKLAMTESLGHLDQRRADGDLLLRGGSEDQAGGPGR